MTMIVKSAINILRQLKNLVNQIQESDFSRSSDTLSGSSIGQHVRHILEFYECFAGGYTRRVINYDKRPHNKLIESDKAVALEAIERAIAFVSGLQETEPLKLEVGYDLIKDECISVDTNTVRELIYNIEHAVHHMAIIKIGVREIAPNLELGDDFGMAASTVRFNLAEAVVAKS